MQYDQLVVFLEPRLTLRWSAELADDLFSAFPERQYVSCCERSELYDVLIGKENFIVGFQLHPVDDIVDALFERADRPPYVGMYEGFPTIWLGAAREGTGRALEAFGTGCFRTADDRWAIVLEIMDWLSPEEKNQVRAVEARWV